MNLRFARHMIRREGRSSARRLGLHTLSIAIGVAALVAINSFRANIERSVREQARNILGADLVARSNREFPDSVQFVFDSLAAAGVPVSYLTHFASMALAPRTGLTRLVQLRAAEGELPYYGTVETDPAGIWDTYGEDRHALVDPAIMVQLDLEIGDTIRLGDTGFVVTGVVTQFTGRVSLQAAIGPRVYIHRRYLPETRLIRRGSRAFYEAHVKLPQQEDLSRLLQERTDLFRHYQFNLDTVRETEDELSEAFDILARFLGLVGLSALLLGGVGVASAIHVFVRSRLDTVALLRCLGARQTTAFVVYLAQAALMGLVGAALGAMGGVAVQFVLPGVLRDFLPLDLDVRLHPPALLVGVGIGLLVALLFALIPLLTIKDVPPLRALRRDLAVGRRRDPWKIGAVTALLATVTALSMWQAPLPIVGLAFAGALGITAFALWLTAVLLMRGTRKFFPTRARYVVRQGVSNLFRPRNQTVAVTLALGFGMFLIAMLYVVQRNLTDQFAIDARPDRPNLVLFDIQPDQRAGVRELLTTYEMPRLQATPIVPARVAGINGRSVEEILAGPDAARYEGWALRRQYRHTYRDTLVRTERLVAGSWWPDGPGGREPGGAADPGRLPRISVEQDIAESLDLSLDDRVTWNVQGVEIETRVASIRFVDWARFEPNFFVVFEPGALEAAPQMLVVLTRNEDPMERARFQRDLVERFPNVAALDLTIVQQTIDTIVNRVSLAIRFMALFSIAAGLVILMGALATSRLQRVRESVLLKTLGATARQVRGVLMTEYFALGALAGLSGVLLAAVGGWAAMRFLFKLPFALPAGPLLVFWLGNALLTTGVGLVAGRDVVRKPPLAVLRKLSE